VKTNSNLQRVLESGAFAVTAECGPPRSADKDVVLKKGLLLKKHVDAVNVTDNQTAIVRMGSLAASALLKSIGLDPVWQLVCRDRNRIAIQSDILGAAALGINNMLCLSGDHQCFGNQAHAKNVFDLDSMQLLGAARDLCADGKFVYDDYQVPQSDRPALFLGAAANPFADPFEFRVIRLAKKIDNGARFIQTQCIFNLPKFSKWIKAVRDAGLADKVYILGGVTPIKSAGMAMYMKKNVAGMDVPDDVIKRIKGAPKDKQKDEGVKIAVETIQKLKKMKGVSGVHIMAIEWEDIVPEIVEAAGLAPRP
jgi:methylenetetrahydrofolate reductase (NADPH)